MIHGDFLKLRTKDWRDADVVFMNSTCFDESLMGKVAAIACKCPALMFLHVFYLPWKPPRLLLLQAKVKHTNDDITINFTSLFSRTQPA